MRSTFILLIIINSLTLGTRLRVASWNIFADFKSEASTQHYWSIRSPFIYRTIQDRNPDILGLQELTFVQVTEIAQWPGYEMYTRESDSGGQNPDGPFTSIVYKKDCFECLEKGHFLLKSAADSRAVLWLKLLHLVSGHTICFFNCRFPLSGDEKDRINCALKIRQIAGENVWFSAGEHRTIGQECVQSPKDMVEEAFDAFANFFEDALGRKQDLFTRLRAFDAISSYDSHFGYSSTWVGTLLRRMKSSIKENVPFPSEPVMIDSIGASMPSLRSAHILPVFDKETGELEYSPTELKDTDCWASDHCMVEADYEI